MRPMRPHSHTSEGRVPRRKRRLAAARRVGARRAEQLRRAADKELTDLRRSRRPIVVGPWTGSIGLELTYWIPLLRWMTTRGGFDPERIAAISRGGADIWYSDIAGRYVDLLDHFSHTQVQSRRGSWQREPTGRARESWLERSAFRIACDTLGTSRAEWLHPSLMARLFAPRLEWNAPLATTSNRTVHQRLPSEPAVSLQLPDSYVAFKVCFNPTFPDTRENRALLDRLIGELSRRTEIVLLRGPEELEGDHPFVPESAPVHDTSDLVTPRFNLAVQTCVVREARVFVSTYNGLASLGPYVGTPTVALYTRAAFDPMLFETIERIGRRLAEGGTRLFRARHLGAIPLVRQASAAVDEVVVAAESA